MNKNAKKTGLIVGGVVAALVAASPMAFAGGDKHHDHHGPERVCAFQGEDGAAGSAITGDSLANAVVQAPIAGNNIGNIGNCSDFLNNNLNHNLSGNVLDLL